MKVFISWSGERSRHVADLLNDWIRCVLQASRPWISTQNIDRGALWFNEIQTQLQDTSVGIICLTQDNKTKPWILFESGALAKGLSASRVCTFLTDLAPADIENPLAQFNHTFPERESMAALVRTLNRCMPADQILPPDVLDQVFEVYWPSFESKFKEILAANPAPANVEARGEREILSEILDNTRSLGARVNELEKAQRLDTQDDGRRFFFMKSGGSVDVSGPTTVTAEQVGNPYFAGGGRALTVEELKSLQNEPNHKLKKSRLP